MTKPAEGPEPDGQTRPEDVDTAFWLWVVALPLLVTGFLTDVVTAPTGVPVVIAFAVYLVIMVVAVVITFLVLMRAGYRWARTVLTAGGLSSIMYVTVNLFVTERSEIAALVYAATGIFGAVLTAGGIYLLHRRDSHAYFTR